MNDTQDKIGKILNGPHDRDAIHIAVAPVTASRAFAPGQHVDIANGVLIPCDTGCGVGIIDPYLSRNVKQGEQCFVFLYPGTITTLRHAWRHPAFKDDVKSYVRPQALEESEQWLRNFATEYGIDYDDLLTGVLDGSVVANSGRIYEIEDGKKGAFWLHYETVTGERLSETRKENVSFSCSC